MSTADQADTINQATSDPVPFIQAPLSTEIKLLRGVGETGEDGTVTWHDLAQVRELNGSDEEHLSSIEKKVGLTYTEYMDALLERTVVKIGNLVVSNAPGMLGKLILADRDMLFLGVMRATYGTEREIRARCSACGETNDVVINLDTDFPIKKADFDLRAPLEVKLSKGKLIKLRLPNGSDTIAAQKTAKSDAELNTVMLSRCSILDDNDTTNPLDWARSLNVADRRKLVNTLLNIEIGPSLEGVETQCDECGAEMPILLDWVSLLLS